MQKSKCDREGAVSRVLRRTESSIVEGDLIDDNRKYSIEIADTPEKREDAFRLAYDVYLSKGYIDANDTKMFSCELDHIPDTTIIVVYNENKEALATATLNFENYCSMPCRDIFDKELMQLKTDKSQVAEVTRLAIKDTYRDSALLLMQLFHALLIYSYKIKKNESVVVEVSPKHAPFYQKLLGFEILSGEVPCSRVNGVPAVLLHLVLSELNQSIEESYINKNKNFHKRIVEFSLSAKDAGKLENKFRNLEKPKFNFKNIVSQLFLDKQEKNNYNFA